MKNLESPKDAGEHHSNTQGFHEGRVLVAFREPISYAPAVYVRSACGDGHFQELTDSRLKSKTSPDTRDEPVIEEFTMGPLPGGGSLHEQHMKEQRGGSKKGVCVPGESPDIVLLQSFKYYLYGGDVPCILAITDNLRAQVHMLRQAALEEAVIHHLSHVNGSADGSSTSL